MINIPQLNINRNFRQEDEAIKNRRDDYLRDAMNASNNFLDYWEQRRKEDEASKVSAEQKQYDRNRQAVEDQWTKQQRDYEVQNRTNRNTFLDNIQNGMYKNNDEMMKAGLASGQVDPSTYVNYLQNQEEKRAAQEANKKALEEKKAVEAEQMKTQAITADIAADDSLLKPIKNENDQLDVIGACQFYIQELNNVPYAYRDVNWQNTMKSLIERQQKAQDWKAPVKAEIRNSSGSKPAGRKPAGG